MAVKCGPFPKEPQIRSITLKGKSFERYLDPLSPNGCRELGTMMRSIKCTRTWPSQHTFKETNVGWPRCEKGTSILPAHTLITSHAFSVSVESQSIKTLNCFACLSRVYPRFSTRQAEDFRSFIQNLKSNTRKVSRNITQPLPSTFL
jgi:hypothetical protein